MLIKELILASLLVAASLTYAATPVDSPDSAENQGGVAEEAPGTGSATAKAFVDSLHFKTGKVVLGDNLATLNLPEQFVFLDSTDAERVLVDAWGNPPDEKLPMGMILPAGISPLSGDCWAVTIEYDESGYVSDEDAADIDYEEMLEDLKEQAKEDNQWRAENGYESVELIGWASAPRYDSQGKKLHWAKELKFGDSEAHTLNYNIRVLGRKGVLVLNFIAGMDQLPQIEQSVPSVLAMAEFNDGSRYADFNPDIDKVAAYGLGALVAGKLAAKAGLFATALLLLKKLWMLPVLLFGWIVKRLGGKKSAP
ncbi:DUF2167 domain-containing protein [Pseudomonas sp. CAU 1711]|uniref:DUF2167 domain-containing protein n=1 Tax=Pseudomonas sp. CAU 1711 TaxID=3140356 RepID=UPI003261A499